jgi:hypothetical protein
MFIYNLIQIIVGNEIFFENKKMANVSSVSSELQSSEYCKKWRAGIFLKQWKIIRVIKIKISRFQQKNG